MAGAPPEGGWIVRVSDDHRAPVTAPGQTIAIAAGGLATSSTAMRAWPRRRARAPHRRPGDGRPGRAGWRTVSVAAVTCLEANVAATASIVLGESAVGWLARRALPARLVRPAGDMLAVAGWPEDAEQDGER